MARVNVDDDWFADSTKRRAALIREVSKLPSDFERQADGLAVDAWRLAQRYWKDGKKLIPEDIWARSGLEPLIKCDLAIRKADGIYVRGTEEQAEWLRQRVEAAKLGGEARAANSTRDEHGRFISRDPLNNQPDSSRDPAERWTNSSREPADIQAATSPPSLALTPALTPALKLKDKESSSSYRGATSEHLSTTTTTLSLLEIWNAHCGGELPQAARLSRDRREKVEARWRENPDPEFWTDVVKRLAKSPVATGRVKSERFPNGWRATFDWLIEKEANSQKVAEGRYCDPDPSSRRKSQSEDLMKMLAEEDEKRRQRGSR